MDKNIRFKIALTIAIVGILSLVSGTSYAILKDSVTSEHEQIIKSGSVLLKLTESYEGINKNIVILSDAEGLIQEETYNFNIRNIGSVSAKYDLKLVNATPDSYTGNVLDEKYVKVGLEINGEEHGPFSLEEIENIIDTNTINKNEIINYKLRIWLDEEKESELANMENYKSFLNIEVEANQNEYGNSRLATRMLMAKVGESGLEEVTHEADSTLQIGATESLTEYRFRGGNDVVTNNYIYFNCEDINNQTADTCELYRIIGVFPTDDGTGKIENRVKLIKAENYGNNYWNSNGTNNWAEPATLNTTFNTTYWGTINASYQQLIGNTKYYLGGYNDSEVLTSLMYTYERKISGSDYYYSGSQTNWIGKIALMYASDYGYGANSTCSESTNLYNYNTNSCSNNNWLLLGSIEWILPHYSDDSDYAFFVRSDGYVSYGSVNSNDYGVRPVLYLTANAQFNDIGDGTSGNPYQLKG